MGTRSSHRLPLLQLRRPIFNFWISTVFYVVTNRRRLYLCTLVIRIEYARVRIIRRSDWQTRLSFMKKFVSQHRTNIIVEVLWNLNETIVAVFEYSSFNQFFFFLRYIIQDRINTIFFMSIFACLKWNIFQYWSKYSCRYLLTIYLFYHWTIWR